MSLVDVTGDRRSGDFLAQRISIAIQRGYSASILGTLPQGPVLDLRFCKMIRRPLTEITLKLDDLQEYETMRRDQGSSNSSSAEMQEDTKPLSAGPKTQEEIHNRIGYAPKKKSRGVSTV